MICLNLEVNLVVHCFEKHREREKKNLTWNEIWDPPPPLLWSKKSNLLFFVIFFKNVFYFAVNRILKRENWKRLSEKCWGIWVFNLNQKRLTLFFGKIEFFSVLCRDRFEVDSEYLLFLLFFAFAAIVWAARSAPTDWRAAPASSAAAAEGTRKRKDRWSHKQTGDV